MQTRGNIDRARVGVVGFLFKVYCDATHLVDNVHEARVVEQNDVRKQLCTAQQEEIDRLRKLLVIQRDRNRALAEELEEVTGR